MGFSGNTAAYPCRIDLYVQNEWEENTHNTRMYSLKVAVNTV